METSRMKALIQMKVVVASAAVAVAATVVLKKVKMKACRFHPTIQALSKHPTKR